MENRTQDHVLQAGSIRARLARTYAESLLAVAQQQHAVESVGSELFHFVDEVLASAPEIDNFLASPVIGKKAKLAALEAALPGHVSDILRGFFYLLARNSRLDLLRGIAAVYRQLLDARSGRVPVKITSAVGLSEPQRATLLAALTDMLRQEPVLHERVDPDVLGGLIVQVGDRVFDSSVRTRLLTLRNRLLETPT